MNEMTVTIQTGTGRPRGMRTGTRSVLRESA